MATRLAVLAAALLTLGGLLAAAAYAIETAAAWLQ